MNVLPKRNIIFNKPAIPKLIPETTLTINAILSLNIFSPNKILPRDNQRETI